MNFDALRRIHRQDQTKATVAAGIEGIVTLAGAFAEYTTSLRERGFTPGQSFRLMISFQANILRRAANSTPSEDPAEPEDLDQHMRGMAEMVYAHYREWVLRGFSESEALAATISFQEAMLNSGGGVQ